MSGRSHLVCFAALVAIAWTTSSAQIAEATPDSAGEPVRVYTNEDLDALPPLPSLVIVDEAGRPLKIEGAEERWAFVDSVLGQAYARIDADRRYWLQRRRTEAEADALERIRSRPRYLLPYNYFYRRGVDVPRREHRLRREASRLWERPNAHLFQPITPIHARPYQSNLFRAQSRFPVSPPGQGAGGGVGSRGRGR
mgnify:CR=1 FL=1